MIDLALMETHEFLKKFKNFAIYKNESEEFELFERYTLIETNKGVKLTRFSDDSIRYFSSAQSAVTWATLDKLNKINDATIVLQLDQQISGLIFEMDLHKKMIREQNREISYIKLSEIKHKISSLNHQLEFHVNRTRNWQMKQFAKKV